MDIELNSKREHKDILAGAVQRAFPAYCLAPAISVRPVRMKVLAGLFFARKAGVRLNGSFRQGTVEAISKNAKRVQLPPSASYWAGLRKQDGSIGLADEIRQWKSGRTVRHEDAPLPISPPQVIRS